MWQFIVSPVCFARLVVVVVVVTIRDSRDLGEILAERWGRKEGEEKEKNREGGAENSRLIYARPRPRFNRDINFRARVQSVGVTVQFHYGILMATRSR